MARLAPDVVILNGTIHTQGDDALAAGGGPVVEALAVLDGRVVATGTSAEVRALAGRATRELDLGGATAIPGLVDAHVHFLMYGLGLTRVDLDGAASRQEAVARVGERAARTPAGAWLIGRGWNRNAWDGQFPSAADLDAVTGDRPAFFSSRDGHAGWANTAALRAAGITDSTPDPEGGQIQRQADSRATGILFERAMALVWRVVPEPTAEQNVEAACAATEAAARHGLVGVYSMEDNASREAFGVLRERGELKTRVTISIPVDKLDAAIALGLRSGQGDGWLRLGGVKIFTDGALGPQTALMLEPYEGGGGTGIEVTPRPVLFETVERAARHGIYAVMHAIGDATNRNALDAVEGVRRQGIGPELRHRIEHVQIIHPTDAPRLARLGVIASMQPNHATSDWRMADRYWGERCRGTAYAWRTLAGAGAVLAFGTDCPVEPIDPLFNIWAAVTRRDARGEPPGGWYPEECLTVAESIRAYTLGSAYADGLEGERGRLRPGYRADLTVLSADPYTLPTEALRELRIEQTIVSGEVAWSR